MASPGQQTDAEPSPTPEAQSSSTRGRTPCFQLLELICAGLICTLSACAPHPSTRGPGLKVGPTHSPAPPGSWHRVTAGETATTVAKRYRIPLIDLTEINSIEPGGQLKIGQEIYIPGIQPPTPTSPHPIPASAGLSSASSLRNTAEGVRTACAGPSCVSDQGRASMFRWPTKKVRVSSHFGSRWGRLHEGIDIALPSGTDVYAAAAGTVIYTGKVRGYGHLVLVKHDATHVTVYGHLQTILMREGQRVKQGQRIALSGNTGRSTGPHLHFEIRVNGDPVDPLLFLENQNL